ncbi:trypsin-like peptidase domain-containing protein [Candidatus Poribacteria bacterium]|nr:trypsin-like peptidase domain-containing protein [Candidatus Poribacteria bacterium]
MTQISFEHQIAYLTARIDVEIPNKPPWNGTGFFYRASLNDETDRSIILLISNKHVFLGSESRLDPMTKWTISLNRKKTDNTPEFGNIIPFTQVGFGDQYFAHPDQDVDLACINVSRIAHTDAFFRFLDDEFLTPINYEKVAPGSEVMFVGSPVGISDAVNNLPLIRKGFIASMPEVDFNGKGQIVIDAQIFHGSSGSPVFVDWDNEYSLLGVVLKQ